mmetsp:Transcript_49188/g.100434  ORF Transcript_49188/g.100434 Transcript_49188/m.100434 type:complete len:235 (-) Transcript_49188:43-747(-)|eukprot:CAMPEP_0181315496 /NCGR_PEP_ID=MMETSP1101-20121128/15411_1 /TAXON_ID=46948 /ORGANISM="Rhodomonas abbreviata, Strain Caron Lab Isolate" /LENGTH=234 /DNA_ID=CAMNT_0023422717 /DNA_START=420 /DNA_END=1124 /DNA_ORIENTATION=+
MNHQTMNAVPEVTVSSFSFKTGLPSANVVLDVRFLPDPRHLEEYNPKITGKHCDVEQYIRSHNCFEPFFNVLKQKVDAVLQDGQARGLPRIWFAFGCTAGRHRSVFVAEYLSRWLRDYYHLTKITVKHRDLVENECLIMDLDETMDGNNCQVYDQAEPVFPGIGPLMTCTYHPDTEDLDVKLQPPQQPSTTGNMNTMLLSGLQNIKMLREKRQRSSCPAMIRTNASCEAPSLIV